TAERMAAPDQWRIDGTPYLLHRVSLTDTQYQLLTLAKLDQLPPIRHQHFWTACLVGVFGLLIIIFSGRLVAQMTARRQEEQYAANYDALTGLPNRRAILAELNKYFTLASQSRQRVLLTFIDMDGFKAVNDTYGHDVGDKFLIEAGRRLQAGLR